jgi:hypothetical protein
MPMMAVYEQNDARSSARLLASSTLRELDAFNRGGTAAVAETVTLNMYRLLDDYRAHQFYGLEDSEPDEDEFSQTSMQPFGERHLSDLSSALERTLDAIGGERDVVIDRVEDVLRAITYPDMGKVDAEGVDLTKRFLTALLGNLARAGN